MDRKISLQPNELQNRAKIMFKSLSADLKPAFDWLRNLNVIDDNEHKTFVDDPPMFFKELRNGYILSKLSIVAIKLKSETYRDLVYSSPKTR